ncbi:MAG: hypothetical protein HGA20_14945 [Geobacteraceae bacterium]|nr:hypothetical protein [Geobacteraceae bacterium]
MSEENTIAERCPAHSGMENKNSTILWMLGILISLMILSGGAQFAMMSDMKSQLATLNYRAISSDKSSDALQDKLQQMDVRLQGLENRANKQ